MVNFKGKLRRPCRGGGRYKEEGSASPYSSTRLPHLRVSLRSSQKKNLKIAEAREARKKKEGVRKERTLLERARAQERMARKAVIVPSARAKKGKDSNSVVGGRVNDTVKGKQGGKKGEKGGSWSIFGGKKKNGGEGEEEKKETSSPMMGGGGRSFRDSRLGVMPLERVSIVEKDDVTKHARENLRREIMKNEEKAKKEAAKKGESGKKDGGGAEEERSEGINGIDNPLEASQVSSNNNLSH